VYCPVAFVVVPPPVYATVPEPLHPEHETDTVAPEIGDDVTESETTPLIVEKFDAMT
jgi:hypothetical protein